MKRKWWVFCFSLVVGLLSIVSITLFRERTYTEATLPTGLEEKVGVTEKAADECRLFLKAKNERFHELEKLVESGASRTEVAAALESLRVSVWENDNKWLKFLNHDNDCVSFYLTLLDAKALNSDQQNNYLARMKELDSVRKLTYPYNYFKILERAKAIAHPTPTPVRSLVPDRGAKII